MPAPIPRGSLHDFGTHHVPGLVGPRRVRVYVAGRRPAGAPRPTLFMFDGQNVFGDEGSFSGGWHAHEALDRVAARSHASPVIVAIDHGNEHRIAEMTPFDKPGQTSTLATWLEWLALELAPRIHKEFGTTPGPEHTALAGSSMGGLAALYGHFRFPRHFGRACVMSPAFWIVEDRLFPFIERRDPPAESRIYLDCGAKEGLRMMGHAERMAGLLRQRGYTKHNLLWRPDARGKHNEASWRRRLPMALRFLFRR